MATGRDEVTGSTVEARQAVMALCAAATQAELDGVLSSLGATPALVDLRPVETGSVMLRGRAGGTGDPFNLGEATVTRAAVARATGGSLQGFAFHLGRDRVRARQAAAIDLLWQDLAYAADVERALEPVRDRLAAAAALQARRAAATRVNFFTLARGED